MRRGCYVGICRVCVSRMMLRERKMQLKLFEWRQLNYKSRWAYNGVWCLYPRRHLGGLVVTVSLSLANRMTSMRGSFVFPFSDQKS